MCIFSLKSQNTPWIRLIFSFLLPGSVTNGDTMDDMAQVGVVAIPGKPREKHRHEEFPLVTAYSPTFRVRVEVTADMRCHVLNVINHVIL